MKGKTMDLVLDLVLEDIPAGFHAMPVEAVYRKDQLVVLLGAPDEHHSCDEMECGSVGPHVLAWAEIVVPEPELTGEEKPGDSYVGP